MLVRIGLCLFLFPAFLYTGNINCNCPQYMLHAKCIFGKYIIGGDEVEIGMFPWMTAVFIKRKGIKHFQCGGALVSDKHVITAAHCVTNIEGITETSDDLFHIRLGEHNLFSPNDSSNPIDLPIKSVKYHEDFEFKTHKNDIAILTIDGTVTFNSRICPIPLPSNIIRFENLTNREALTIGWGTTTGETAINPVLNMVSVPIWEPSKCRHSYENYTTIFSSQMCAGFEDGGKDACQGDSGGPLMLNVEGCYFLVGISSFGHKCAAPGFPGVYTRVVDFLDWIKSNTT